MTRVPPLGSPPMISGLTLLPQFRADVRLSAEIRAESKTTNSIFARKKSVPNCPADGPGASFTAVLSSQFCHHSAVIIDPPGDLQAGDSALSGLPVWDSSGLGFHSNRGQSGYTIQLLTRHGCVGVGVRYA